MSDPRCFSVMFSFGKLRLVSFYLCSSTLLPWQWASDASLFAHSWKRAVGHQWHRQSTCTGNGIGWDCPGSSSGLMQYRNDFCRYFFLMASKPFILSEDLNVTRCSWICFIFPLWGHLSLRSKVWLPLDLCTFCADEEYLSSVSNPTSTFDFSMVYTYEPSSDFSTLSSHTWPWILWIFYCLSTTCFFFLKFSSRVVREFCLFWTGRTWLYFTCIICHFRLRAL